MSTKTAVYDPGHCLKGEGLRTKNAGFLEVYVCVCSFTVARVCVHASVSMCKRLHVRVRSVSVR